MQKHTKVKMQKKQKSKNNVAQISTVVDIRSCMHVDFFSLDLV